MTRDNETTPSPNGDNGGRDGSGRFAAGNPGGPGNPYASAVSKWRRALSAAVTPQDIQDIVLRLVDKAKAGEAWAIKEVLDRTLGRPKAPESDPNEEEACLSADYLEFLDTKGKL